MIQLQPKTLQRIRDKLLADGQAPSIAFSAAGVATREADPFEGDDEARERFEALVEAMYLMMAADGDVGDAEREVLRGAVRDLTSNAIRSAHIDKLVARFSEAREKDGWEGRLAAISAPLTTDPVLAEAAFVLSAAIAFADSEIKDEENELINELAEALKIDSDRADELLNELEEDSDAE